MVDDEPDFTGALYTGLKSGSNPLLDIRAYEIIDPAIVCDFNLPDPANWISTKRVLPAVISGSQLAIIDGYDGYVYLFGGQNSDKIYRAPTNNPADWIDTGAKLPTKLSNSQLAIVDGYIYLFGGFNDGYNGAPTDEIYSAAASNPLIWTNFGSLLPIKLSNSQLIIVNDNIYLLGGMSDDGVTDVILRAPTSNPLNWIDTGQILPHKLSNSQACISETDGYSDGYLMLLGGQIDGYSITNNIYYAPISNPISWSIGGNLPSPASGGQFAQVSGKGYLFTPANVGASFTRIFQCDLAKPFSWTDKKFTIPGQIYQSQLAIISDRLWLFGGSGSSVIFADTQILKYNFASVPAAKYGDITRTQASTASDPMDLFKVLSMPPWKTAYSFLPAPIVPPVIPPTLSSMSPNLGDIDGNIWIQVIGNHLLTTTHVIIGGMACTNIIIVDDNTVWCKTPALSAGIYDLKVITTAGDFTLFAVFEAWDATQITSPAVAHVYDSEEGLTLAGNLVNAWNDQGSLAANLTGSGATRPAYLPNRFADNTRHGLNFEPAAAVNVLSLAAPISSQNRTVFAVFKWLATAGGDTSPIINGTSGSIYDFSLDSTGGLTTMRLYDANTATNHRSPNDPELSSGASADYTDGGNGGSGKLIGEIVDGAAGFVSFYLNNTQQGSAQVITVATTNWNKVGSGGGNFTAGELGVVIVVEDIISALDRSKLVTWMWGKWLARSSAFSRINVNTPWFARDGAQLLALGDDIYMLGGWNRNGGGVFPAGKAVTNEIWKSIDKGATWALIKANDYTPAPANSFWTPRHTQGAVVHNINGVDYLYIIGSDIFNGPQNNVGTGAGTSDVWSSPDGVNWTRITDTAPWGPRVLHMVASFQGALYVMGGMTDINNTNSVLNDVWKSTNGGAAWVQLANAPWAPRGIVNSGQGLPVFNGKLYLMGGGTYSNVPAGNLYNDVWNFDGTNWVLVTSAAAWSPRQYHATVAWEGKLWVMDGATDFIGTNSQEVWNSLDGINWFEQTITPWRASHADGVVAISDRIVKGPGNGQIGAGSFNGIGKVYAITRLGFVHP